METLSYTNLKTTRDFLQDIAKIVGKVQQVFLPPDPNFWHMGLELTDAGLATQVLPDGTRIIIDIKHGFVTAGLESWNLAEISAPALLELFQQWLVARGVGTPLTQPELSTAKRGYNKNQANKIADALYFANDILVEVKHEFVRGVVSPVLLYPHHFDLSLAWFPNRTNASEKHEKQYTFGFSTGDATITEPYFYATLYPKTSQFDRIVLPAPAYWHHKDFVAAIMNYNDATSLHDPANAITAFYKTILAQYSQSA